MNITKITYHCPDDSMGDLTADEAAAYRSHLATEAQAEFPGTEIVVTDKQTTYGTAVEVDDQADYYDALQDAQEFGQRVWDAQEWLAA